jgi:hypothetical protein
VDQGGEYALALKGNQGTLHDDVILLFDDPTSKTTHAKPVVDAGHGRIETRAATVSTDVAWLVKQPRIRTGADWETARTISPSSARWH